MKCKTLVPFFLKINTLLFYVHIDQGIYRVKCKEAGNEKCLLFIFKKFLGHFIKHRVLFNFRGVTLLALDTDEDINRTMYNSSVRLNSGVGNYVVVF